MGGKILPYPPTPPTPPTLPACPIPNPQCPISCYLGWASHKKCCNINKSIWLSRKLSFLGKAIW
ncbi:hypothetical protein H6G98_07475 [Nostoc sp. FACHB-857]|nr:hypothetical protein [Nostoc sp. FACHB-857]